MKGKERGKGRWGGETATATERVQKTKKEREGGKREMGVTEIFT